MKRLFIAAFALTFATAPGCAEQPGKKKEEETKEGKVETKAIDGSKPAEAKPAEAKPEEKK